MIENSTRPPLMFPSVATEEELKAELQKVLNLKVGRVRGMSLKNDSHKSIEAFAGVATLEKIQAKLTELGFNIDITHLDSYEWYPVGYEVALYLVAAHLFDWCEDDVEKLGRVATRGSLFVKIIMKFISVEATLKSSPKYWSKFYDFGELIPLGYSEKEQSVMFQLKGVNVHPIFEIQQRGYFKGVVELITGSKNVVLEVYKSAAQGDEYTEYKISW
ncbi:MAG: hypothetical protein WDZ74_01855 [Candidatus Paceibacterota bacterium]